jgi:hypothetical protein
VRARGAAWAEAASCCGRTRGRARVWLEVGDDPDGWGPPGDEKEKGEERGGAGWAVVPRRRGRRGWAGLAAWGEKRKRLAGPGLVGGREGGKKKERVGRLGRGEKKKKGEEEKEMGRFKKEREGEKKCI